MSAEDLKERIARARAKVECPICRHRQWLAEPEGRCDQCGSEITVFETHEDADRALAELTEQGRLAYLRELGAGLFAVSANRAFHPRTGP